MSLADQMKAKAAEGNQTSTTVGNAVEQKITPQSPAGKDVMKEMQQKLFGKDAKLTERRKQDANIPAAIPANQPVRERDTQILFVCSRPTMNFHTEDKERISFENRYLLLDEAEARDRKVIAHIRKNYIESGLVRIAERGAIAKVKE